MERVTVKDLIQKLQEFNLDSEVWISSSEYYTSPMDESNFPKEEVLDKDDLSKQYKIESGKKVILFFTD